MTEAQSSLIVLAAGGTGGHIFPAEALAGELNNRGFRQVLITDRRGGHFKGGLGDLETHRIQAGGVVGKSVFARMKSMPELAIGTLQARALLNKLMPAAVVGFGGYAAFPTMMAATLAGYPTVIHEQNAVLGRANRLLASRVDRIATSFEQSQGLPKESNGKAVRTGMPVRPEIVAKRDVSYPAISSDGPVNLLIFGGSQGARVLSDVVPAAIERIDQSCRNRLVVTQQCREEDLARVKQAYNRFGMKAELAAFFADIPERLASAHLVIGRAGASTIAEITAVGRPAILVPYPYAVDDHQMANAHALDEAGGGWLIPEDSFNAKTLAGRLNDLFGYPAMLEKAAGCAHAVGRPDAASAFADLVCNLLQTNGRNGNGGSDGHGEGRQAA